jgi:prepilin-type N-terminal cleavage/methylation domain-containing protein
VIRFAGFTLLEILVSLFILALLLLGLDAIQIRALASAKSTYYFSVATEQIRSISERLQATEGGQRDALQAAWNEQNKLVLPQGYGVISGNPPTFILTIFWGKNLSLKCDRDTYGQSGCIRTSIKIRERF